MSTIRKRVWMLAGASILSLGWGATALTFRLPLAHTIHPRTHAALTLPGDDRGATLLFNGWRLSPVGRPIATGDMPSGGAFSPDGKTLAIANTGFDRHALHLLDVASEKQIATIPLAHAGNGVAWSPDGQRLYVAGGISTTGRDIYRIEPVEGNWKETGTFKLGSDPKQTAVMGLALLPDGKTLCALNLSDNRLYTLDTASGNRLAALEVGDHPVACQLAADGKSLHIANWGGKEIVVVNVGDPTKPTVVRHIPTGDHPNALVLAGDGRLFVSCGNADAVMIHDARTGKQQETVKTTLTPNALPGSTPNALALSPDGKTLYVANADNNDVAVMDVSLPRRSRVIGFIPTGWYPSAVLVAPDGKLIVGNGKGIGTRPNMPTVKPDNPVAPSNYKFQYIGTQLNGSLAFVDVPTRAQLTDYTKQVLANTPGLAQTASSPYPAVLGGRSPIRHILYIIKENRTYDQVFGDMPQGNGDPNLTLFGREVTPNHHALAEQFVLLDNIYCNGEVSVDGHNWCDAAIATDFTQRFWVQSYSGKGKMAESDSVETPAAGYLWDACKRKGLTYRSYGESFDASSSADAPIPKVEAAAGLIGHGSERYVGVGQRAGTDWRDMNKADVFLEEFRAYEKAGKIPNFMVMSLGEDHTSATRPGAYTPKACVASNDQALGKIVEGISHSAAWKETAIFVIEDDAQNGPDHVDAHRTVALVISPYTRRNVVDSTMYSTASMVKTIELILGLPPLTQYDAAAPPMAACFTDKVDTTPFTLLPPRVALNTRNKAGDFASNVSVRMDLSKYDHADPDQMNWVLWHAIKGTKVSLPAPVHATLVVNRSLLTTPASRAGDD